MPMSRHPLSSPGELGRLIRAVRITSGLTQADTAALCDVSAPFLSELERGKPTARLEPILKVCAGLGIRLEALSPVELPRDLHTLPARIPRRKAEA